jgi:hypothetical protein
MGRRRTGDGNEDTDRQNLQADQEVTEREILEIKEGHRQQYDNDCQAVTFTGGMQAGLKIGEAQDADRADGKK